MLTTPPTPTTPMLTTPPTPTPTPTPTTPTSITTTSITTTPMPLQITTTTPTSKPTTPTSTQMPIITTTPEIQMPMPTPTMPITTTTPTTILTSTPTSLTLGKAVITLVSPSEKNYKLLLDNWSKNKYQNEASISLLIEYGGSKALFTGDSFTQSGKSKDGLRKNIKTILPTLSTLQYVDVPHHGSAKNSDVDFWKAFPSSIYLFSGNHKAFKGTSNPTLECMQNIVEAYVQNNRSDKINILFTYLTPNVKLFQNFVDEKKLSNKIKINHLLEYDRPDILLDKEYFQCNLLSTVEKF
eukprot:TRINITY_DN1666_c0_g1_i4.p2 TRINITY_DN1666_c0_g1~~TRINITY_DN1666_c0_g1_i4.p2  ORF type:complete len:297 (+),score=54.19 TRINITY_DN1666_c0_g1_i4:2034-2924(+)